MFKFENKTIIAMKGPFFHRKTDFATHIAASLKCPVLSLADFLRSPTPNNIQTSPSSNTCKPQPEDLAFEIICQIVDTNLSNGFVESIVIDSPLSSQSHFHKLMKIAGSIQQTRLVIVQCRTDNIFKLETEFLVGSLINNILLGLYNEDGVRHERFLEGRIQNYNPPHTWEEIEKAIRDAYDERCDGYTVPTLVLDPLLDYEDYDERHRQTPPFIEAVKYLITRNEGDGPDRVVYNEWRRSHYLHSDCAGSGHSITQYADKGLGYDAICMACENQVHGAAYTCERCSFALHKKCAELLDDIDNNNPARRKKVAILRFLGQFRCNSYKEKDTPSDSCGDCLFTTHLKRRKFPTVIRHKCDEHFLSIRLLDLNPYEKGSKCKACGDSIMGPVWYSCKSCHVSYHYKCLTRWPLRVEHEHGGHHHHMLLQYSSKELEEYLCDVCFEREELDDRRDPNIWFYSCEECQGHYVAHLGCVADRYNPLTLPQPLLHKRFLEKKAVNRQVLRNIFKIPKSPRPKIYKTSSKFKIMQRVFRSTGGIERGVTGHPFFFTKPHRGSEAQV